MREGRTEKMCWSLDLYAEGHIITSHWATVWWSDYEMPKKKTMAFLLLSSCRCKVPPWLTTSHTSLSILSWWLMLSQGILQLRLSSLFFFSPITAWMKVVNRTKTHEYFTPQICGQRWCKLLQFSSIFLISHFTLFTHSHTHLRRCWHTLTHLTRETGWNSNKRPLDHRIYLSSGVSEYLCRGG